MVRVQVQVRSLDCTQHEEAACEEEGQRLGKVSQIPRGVLGVIGFAVSSISSAARLEPMDVVQGHYEQGGPLLIITHQKQSCHGEGMGIRPLRVSQSPTQCRQRRDSSSRSGAPRSDDSAVPWNALLATSTNTFAGTPSGLLAAVMTICMNLF